jgi:DNA-binding HxlR family transcriptional regulator
MQRTPFSEFACSVARSLEIVGEWWTPLILRDVFLGLRRFDLIQADLGIPRKVLTERLMTLVDNGILEKRPYRDGRIRDEYHLTERGRDFATTLIAIMDWGDRWLSGDSGVPLRVNHSDCGGSVKARLVCDRCNQEVDVDGVTFASGPGARPIKGTAVVSRPRVDLNKANC